MPDTTPLPPTAVTRLGSGVFTTDLAVSELAPLRAAGFSPAGVVIGTAMCRLGPVTQRWEQSVELGMLTQAVRDGRALAIARLEAEAAALEADGVVSLSIDVISHEGAADVFEILATGTALRTTKKSASASTPDGRAFTTWLGGAEMIELIGAGYRPVTIVEGVCVYHVAHRLMRQAMTAGGQLLELPLYTQALYDARELALTRMQDAAAAAEGTGVVGVAVETTQTLWGEQATEVRAAGTAVVAA